MRRTRAQIVAQLEAQGLAFHTFVIEHDSAHALADWDWNQRDLLHVPFVHSGFRFATGVVEDDLVTGIYLQRVLGVRVPMTVQYHHVDACERVYASALGPFALVIEAGLEPLATGTRVRTVYSLGGASVLAWMLPLAERWLRANYHKIHAEDEPLRERRQWLRERGVRFVGDDRGASYRRSLDLSEVGVIAPADHPSEARIELDASAREQLVGDDDHHGLRLIHSGDRLRVYPRLCMHAGACLDHASEQQGGLHCPWHGRRVPPLAEFDLRERGEQVRLTPRLRLTCTGTSLTIEPLEDGQ